MPFNRTFEIGWDQPPIRCQPDAHIELPAFTIECLLQPNDIRIGCGNKLKASNLQGHQFEICEIPCEAIEAGEIHQREIASEFLVTANAFVIVQKVATTVEDGLILVDFDRFRMMGRMAMNYIDSSSVNESMSEDARPFGNPVAPIRAPVNRQNVTSDGGSRFLVSVQPGPAQDLRKARIDTK